MMKSGVILARLASTPRCQSLQGRAAKEKLERNQEAGTDLEFGCI